MKNCFNSFPIKSIIVHSEELPESFAFSELAEEHVQLLIDIVDWHTCVNFEVFSPFAVIFYQRSGLKWF